MRKRVRRAFAVVCSVVLALMLAGCSNDAAGIQVAVEKQLDAFGGSSEGVADAMPTYAAFEDIAAAGIEPSEYIARILEATDVKVGDVAVDGSSATASITLTHPDIDSVTELMAGKAAEFQTSDDYADFGKEDRFARCQEMLNESFAASPTSETTADVTFEKVDGEWELAAGQADAIIEAIVTPAQTAELAEAVKPFSWKYDDMNASQVIEKMKASGLPIGDIQAYDETTDPNGDLLGRPGGYTSKASFLDTRLHSEYGFEWFEGNISTDFGGTVEVFDSVEDARKRDEYLLGLRSTGTLVNQMYQYRKGTVLLRVSYSLTPSQAAEYESEFLQLD